MKLSDIMSLNLLTSRLSRQISLVFSGNVFSAGFGFLAVLLVSRGLSVDAFGLFTMARSVMLVASLFAGLGMDIGMIKFASSYLSRGKDAEASHVLRVTFFVRIVASLVVAAIVFSTAELVSIRIFQYPSLIPLLRLSAFGIVGMSILTYIRSAFCAFQLFRRFVALQFVVDFLKFSFVIVLIFFLKIDSLTAVAAFAVAPIFGVVLGFGQLRHKLLSTKKPPRNLSANLFSYSKWLFVSNICHMTLPYVGIFMLTKMVDSKAAGIYGLALQLAYVFPILMDSLRSVLLPEVSRFKEIEKFERYTIGSLKISLCIGIAAIPFLFLSNKIIPFFFGPRYLASVPVFDLLLIGSIALVVASTMRVALYSFNKPHVLALIDMTRLAIMVLGCYLLIPSLGVSAPAVVALLLNVAILGFLCIYVLRQIKRKDLTIWEESAIEPYSG